MSPLLQQPACSSLPLGSAAAVVGNWTVLQFGTVSSTNLLAAKLPAWHAVRAASQTGGRGRFQRSWVSNQGGLWLSAVVPIIDGSPQAQLLPLAAGLALCDALRETCRLSLRLRWPNDVLVDRRKLAGILIDRFVPGLAVVGIGVNVANRPEELDPELRGQTARLADLVAPAPGLGELTTAVLGSIGAVCRECQALGPEGLLLRINALWQTPIAVQVDLDGTRLTGQFEGVDSRGRLRLRVERGEMKLLEPHEVRLLRETIKH